MTFSAEDRRLMQRALELARGGRYTAHPNPRVGCVISHDGRIVGEGFHRRTGEAHAEINALAAAGEAARGATAHVTLEPCCHQGRTGPCTEALANAGIARVVAAMLDPDRRMAGRGLEALEHAGVQVAHGLLQAEARALNVGYLSRLERGRPWLRAKLAMSLDARTALASGESKWITGADARRDVQRFRALSDAIVTGVDTVLADDPSLKVRAAEFTDPQERRALGDPVRQPLRVVMDSKLRTPPSARLLDGERVWLATCTTATPALAAKAEVVELTCSDGRPSPAHLLECLAEAGINEVWLESGPRLAGAFIDTGLVDEIIIYCAPRLLGHQARPLLVLDGIERMADSIALEFLDVTRVGDDLRIIARPRAS